MAAEVTQGVLEEMKAYYRARAAEYDQWWERRGRYDRGAAANARWFAERDDVYAAFDAIRFTGDVLELAPGTGTWTQRLVKTAARVTAIDAAPEMLELNRQRVPDERVRRVCADLFTWSPDRAYDGIVFGFWISHVPAARLPAFLQMVAAALKPGAPLFFVDGQREPTSTATDHALPDAAAEVLTRKLNDGRSFQIVKSFHDLAALHTHCAAAGLAVTIRTTPTYFYHGIGTRN